jgi:hypothetical protein
MFRFLTAAAASATIHLLTACASASSPPAGAGTPGSITGSDVGGGTIRMGTESRATSISISATPEQVWAVLPSVYQELGIQTEMRDDALRSIGTRGFTGSRIGGKRTGDFVRCANQGSGPSSGGMVRTRLMIVSRVTSAGEGKSELVTEVGGTATPVEGTSTGPTACASTGDLEQRIRTMVEKAISG